MAAWRVGGAQVLALMLLLGPAWMPALGAPTLAAPDVAAEALAFAGAQRGAWGLHPGATLEVRAVRTSLAAEHAWVQQRLGDARVEDGGLAYHRPLDGTPAFAQSRLAALPASLPLPMPALDEAAATALALAALHGPALRAPAAAELLLALDGAAPRLVWAAGIATTKPMDWQVRLDATSGAVLALRDARLRAEGIGDVFLPNPIASSGNGLLRDHVLGLSTPEIAAEVRTVTLRGLSDAQGERGRLVGPHVEVHGVAHDPDLRFQYPREDPRFEEVMVYHHIEEAQRLVQALGFEDLADRRTPASNYPGEVNAFYSRLTRSVHFGYHARDPLKPMAAGFADAAEDAEVIVHEYGHAVLDDAVPGLAGIPGEAIHEAFADFMAASFLSRLGGAFNSCIGEWMSQYVVEGDPPCIRLLNNTRHYPEDFETSLVASPHENGLIWSGALWDLWLRFPREDVERVAFEAHFLLATVPEMPDLGPAALAANRLLGSPLPEEEVAAIMDARGLLGGAWVPHDDAGSGRDAGNHWRTAMPLGPGTYAGQVGSHGDREDWYALDLRGGEVLVLDANTLGAGPPGLAPPTEPPMYGAAVAGAARLAGPGLRAMGPAYGCEAGAGDLRFTGIATQDGAWRFYVPEPPDNDPLDPTVAPYRFTYRITRDYASALPTPKPELAQGAIHVTAEDSLWVRLDGAEAAAVVAPSGKTLAVSKGADQAVLIAHVALDGRVLSVRPLIGPPTTVTVTGSLLGEPADGTWLLRKAHHQTSGAAVGIQLRVGGKVLDDVAPQGDPIDGGGLGGPSAILTPLTAWNWHRSPDRFDASSNDTLVPRPPVSPMCPRLLTS